VRVAEAHRRLGADFRAFVERLPEGVLTYRIERGPDSGVIRYANPALVAMLGYDSAEQLDGLSPLELFAPADLEAVRARMRVVLDSAPSTPPLAVRLRTRDGALRWCEVRSIRVGDQAEPAVMMIARELDEDEDGADPLRLAEERFYKVFQANPACISITRSSDDTFVDVNDRFLAVTGFARDEVLGKTGMQLGLWPAPEQRARLDRAIRAGHTVRDVEVTLLKKSGDPLELLMSLEAFAVGGQECVFAIAHDVTGRKQLEQQVRHSQKMEAIGRLAGGVAHDFNNLLTAIRGYSELLVAELPPETPTRAAAEHVHRSALRASSLTEQLLVFTRRRPHQPRVVALNDVVLSMGALLRRIIGEDITLELQLGNDLGRVRVDPAQLEQVLLNLAINSRDAMAAGGRLTVETANTDDGRVRLSVRDSGVGMTAETRSHIFEPFFTTKEIGKGTGLGLSIVFGVIEQNGGTITVESEPGRGTVFHICLPAIDAPADQEPPSSVSLSPAPPQIRRETILLVEDDEDVRDFVQFVLRQSGYEVLAAEDGPTAVTLAASHPGEIHLLLSDVIMPQMNGVHLVAALRPLRPRMKVLHMSGYPGHSIRGELGTGVAFLQKPFSADALLAMVRAVLDS
jgi:PAS domain S-box-containing protein